ncbi:trehalose phosphatase/synthase 11 [Artemisia annua]|uniref:Trehalose phosphatase/synthase 11 n=1 Tax=Artemisia annua TaxID=35608 RepID=A0A2U1PEW2_ARTAN|nr:trehalose phosphatase/synthase 11 [Artemisia annua]
MLALASEVLKPVTVKRGQQIVEVNPQGVSKGVVVESLIASMQSKGKPLDFILCLGDDRSDEYMFEKISSSAVNPSLQGIAEVFMFFSKGHQYL